MGLIRFVRAHLDAITALLLTAAYLAEVYLADTTVPGAPIVAGLEVSETVALAAGAVFLLTLALRSRMPIVPLVAAIVAATLLGRGQVDAVLTLTLGLVLAAYSVGAWSGGRAAVYGALALGVLTGLLMLRGASDPMEAREMAGPVLILWAPWLLGQAVRRLRVARHDERVGSTRGWAWSNGSSAPDSAGRDETTRELRDTLELLRKENARLASVVELRFFGGLSLEEVAVVLHRSRTSVVADWASARAWLADHHQP